MSARIEWSALIGLGIGGLGLSPEAFWSLTPFELRCAARWRFGEAAEGLPRSSLETLMRDFPDETTENVDD